MAKVSVMCPPSKDWGATFAPRLNEAYSGLVRNIWVVLEAKGGDGHTPRRQLASTHGN